jgi:hypothetical protein
MKREFLQNFRAGDQTLTKEIIDAIMAENGRDIEDAKKPFADYDSIKEQLQTAKDGLKAFEGVDVKDLQGQISKLQGDLTAKEAEYQGKLADLAFEGVLKESITAAKGRNAKAITALLDVDALKASKNQTDDIKVALEALKKDSGYLFDTEQTPPPYSPGTGTGGTGTGMTGLDAIRSAAGLNTK